MISLLDLIYPKRCFGCQKFGNYFCNDCAGKLQLREARCPECDRAAIDGRTHELCLRPLGLNGLTTVFYNHGVIKRAVKALKYRLVTDVTQAFVDVIPDSILPRLRGEWSLYPIPLHRERQRWRGFNQAEVVGKELSKRLRASLVKGLLERKLKRTPQADIKDKDSRIKNARGLFSRNQTRFPEKIILFDDIWTTGATMKEAAKVLKRGGVREVWGLTLGR